MRCSFLLFLIFNLSILTYAQNGKNPFDLGAPVTEEVINTPEEEQATNPFDLHKEKHTLQKQIKSSQNKSNNPFDILTKSETVPTETKQVTAAPKNTDVLTSKEEENDPSANANGWILSLTVIILALTTLIFIFFRLLYHKIYKAVFNDNQLSLLYRERQAGAFGNFFIAYGLFFISTAWFIYLSLVHFDVLPQDHILKNYSLLILALAVLFIAKHLLLTLIASVFPIAKEVRLYSFTIMVFAIVIGLVVSMVDFVLAYSPEGLKTYIIYFTGFFFLLIYLLRSLRSLFIANRFVFNYLFHFLLYLCAVEIAPTVIVYKMILNMHG